MKSFLCLGAVYETAGYAGVRLSVTGCAKGLPHGQCLGLFCARDWSSGLLQRDAVPIHKDFKNAFERVPSRRLVNN